MKFKLKAAAKSYKRLAGFVILMFFGVQLSSFSAHPYYMSVTEIEHKAAEKELQISARIFIDDLEDLLEQELKQPLSLYNEKNKKVNEGYIYTCLQKHLKITIDNRQLAYTMIGFEIQEGAIWAYLVVKNITKIKTAVVYNDILYSLRKNQINIVHFTNKGERKSYRLTHPETQTKFNW